MATPSDVSSAEIKLGLFYDLGKKEILLRFESSAFALAYQAKNPEGRILAEKPREVWLPICESMKSLRSSDGYGMVIVFRSKEESKTWLNRSVLGEDVNTSEGEYGVRFKRAWTRNEFLDHLAYAGYSLKVPKDQQDPHSRPASRQGKNPAPQPYYEPYESAKINPPRNFRHVELHG